MNKFQNLVIALAASGTLLCWARNQSAQARPSVAAAVFCSEASNKQRQNEPQCCSLGIIIIVIIHHRLQLIVAICADEDRRFDFSFAFIGFV